jgi:hypothetical protein
MPINFVAASQYFLREQLIVTEQWRSITPHIHMLTVSSHVEREIVCINPPPPPLSYTHNEYFGNELPSNQIIVPEERKTYSTPEIIDSLLESLVRKKRNSESISSFLEDLKTRHISLPSFNAWNKALGSIVLNNDYSAIVDHMKNFEYLSKKHKRYLSKKVLTLLEEQSTSKPISMNSQQDIKTRFPGLFS